MIDFKKELEIRKGLTEKAAPAATTSSEASAAAEELQQEFTSDVEKTSDTDVNEIWGFNKTSKAEKPKDFNVYGTITREPDYSKYEHDGIRQSIYLKPVEIDLADVQRGDYGEYYGLVKDDTTESGFRREKLNKKEYESALLNKFNALEAYLKEETDEKGKIRYSAKKPDGTTVHFTKKELEHAKKLKEEAVKDDKLKRDFSKKLEDINQGFEIKIQPKGDNIMKRMPRPPLVNTPYIRGTKDDQGAKKVITPYRPGEDNGEKVPY